MALEIEKIREICDRVAESLGLEVVDLEFKGGAGKQGRVLRIFIDVPFVKAVPGSNTTAVESLTGLKSAAENLAETSSPTPSPVQVEGGAELQAQGVTHEDCANLSREVSTILDVEDAIAGGEYLLEVSSPGLDRKLSKALDYERFLGSRVKLMTFAPVGVTEKSKGNRHFEGRLESFFDGKLVLDTAKPVKAKGKKAGAAQPQLVEIEFSNVERANLVPEL